MNTTTTIDPIYVAHSNRFRRVSNLYPRAVAEAYGRDLTRAMADSDDVVAANVAAWERANAIPERDWYAMGASEGKARTRGSTDIAGRYRITVPGMLCAGDPKN